VDAEHYDEEHVRHLEENRPLVNDQPASGEQGISSDKPGVDPGGYPDADGPGTPNPEPDRPEQPHRRGADSSSLRSWRP
jgi:hypothetical protein